MAGVLPLATTLAMAEWTPRGLLAWGDSLLWCFGGGCLLVAVPMAGWLRRHYWSICCWWAGSLLLLLAYPGCLAVASAVPLGWKAPGVPDQRVLCWWALALVLMCLPGCFGLLRLLRLRCFQPWTMPDAWELGDYRAPDWAIKAGGTVRPGLMEELERQRTGRDGSAQRARTPRRPRP